MILIVDKKIKPLYLISFWASPQDDPIMVCEEYFLPNPPPTLSPIVYNFATHLRCYSKESKYLKQAYNNKNT